MGSREEMIFNLGEVQEVMMANVALNVVVS